MGEVDVTGALTGPHRVIVLRQSPFILTVLWLRLHSTKTATTIEMNEQEHLYQSLAMPLM